MKYLIFSTGLKGLREMDDLCNNGINSAENILRYTLRESDTPVDKLIVLWQTDDIYESDNATANFFTRMLFRIKESFPFACGINCIEDIGQISASEGISQTEVEIVKFSDDEKDDWKVFGEVLRIIGESGVPKKDISVTAVDTSVYGSNVTDMTLRLLEIEGYRAEKLYIDPQREITYHSENLLRFELYKAISDYKNTGRTDSFERLSEIVRNKHLTELLDLLGDFSWKLNMCQAEDLEPVMDKIYEILDLLESDDAEDNYYRSLCDDLRSVFGRTKPQILSFVYIRCCISWKLFTQSHILFTESLPKELVAKKIVRCDFSSTTVSPLAAETELFYTLITRNMYIPKEKELKRLLISFLNGEEEDDSNYLYIDDFITLITWFENCLKERGLKIPFEGIDILYDYPEKNDGVRQLIEFIYHNCSSLTVDRFKRKLADAIGSLQYFFKDPLMYDRENVMSMKIMGIKYLYPEHIRRNLKGFKLNIDFAKFSYFKRFLAFFLFIKLIRNKVCHAIDLDIILHEDLNEQHMERLKCFGVDTGTVTSDSVARNITNALGCLEKCLLSKIPRVTNKYYIAVPESGKADDTDLMLRSLFENVQCYDTVQVYIIKDKSKKDILEKALSAKIEEYAINSNFFCDIGTIDHSDEPSELLRNLISTVEPGDKISADTTYMNNLMMYSMIMFFNDVIEKKAEIGKVICKDHCLTDLINSQFSANDL